MFDYCNRKKQFCCSFSLEIFLIYFNHGKPSVAAAAGENRMCCNGHGVIFSTSMLSIHAQNISCPHISFAVGAIEIAFLLFIPTLTVAHQSCTLGLLLETYFRDIKQNTCVLYPCVLYNFQCQPLTYSSSSPLSHLALNLYSWVHLTSYGSSFDLSPLHALSLTGFFKLI